MGSKEEMINALLKRYSCENCGRCCRHERVTISKEDRQRNRRLISAIQDNIILGHSTLKLPCPFISDKNQCTCYITRPSACRHYPIFRKYPGFISISECPYGTKIINDVLEFCKLNGIRTDDAKTKEHIIKMDDAYREMGVGQKERFVALSVPIEVFNAFYKWKMKI